MGGWRRAGVGREVLGQRQRCLLVSSARGLAMMSALLSFDLKWSLNRDRHFLSLKTLSYLQQRGDDVGLVLELAHHDDRAEDLLLYDPNVRLHVGEDSRLDHIHSDGGVTPVLDCGDGGGDAVHGATGLHRRKRARTRPEYGRSLANRSVRLSLSVHGRRCEVLWPPARDSGSRPRSWPAGTGSGAAVSPARVEDAPLRAEPGSTPYPLNSLAPAQLPACASSNSFLVCDTPQWMDADPGGPSFGFLCELILAIGKVRPRPARARAQPKGQPPRSSQLLQAWIARVKSHTDPVCFAATRPITHFFRLFFPEEGARRRSVRRVRAPVRPGRALTVPGLHATGMGCKRLH